MKSKIIRFIKRKTVKQFAIFFALAFVFLVFSKLSNDYRQQLQIEIELNNLPEDIVLLQDSLNSVTAVVEAKGFTLFTYLFSDKVKFQFDAKSVLSTTSEAFVFDVPKHQYLFEQKFGDLYKVRSLKPDTVLFQYSKLKSRKVPIQLKSQITYSPGFDLLGQLKPSSDSARIIGPEQSVNSISKVFSEVLILDELNKDFEKTIPLAIDSFPKVKIIPSSIKVSGKVRRFTEGVFDIPVLVTNKPKDVNIKIFPKSVSVVFYADLERFKSIRPSDFIVECTYPNDINEVTYLVPELIKTPKGVKRFSIMQNQIDFIIL